MDNESAGLTFLVTDADTATALGSGDVPVLATPRLIAWLEAASCAALRERLEAGRTSVGTQIAVEHRAATPVGATVRVTARLDVVRERTVSFALEARDAASGELLADGTHTRVLVDRERFLGRVAARP